MLFSQLLITVLKITSPFFLPFLSSQAKMAVKGGRIMELSADARAAFDAMREGVTIIDTNGIIVFGN